jgi:SAM-dependent methyltransferase
MSPPYVLPLDPRWLEVIDEIGPRALGRDDRRGEALAAQIARVSELYTRERHALGMATGALAARLRFYLPRDLPKVQGPLAELASRDLLPRDRVWRVLDVGAGLGTMTLGAAELARRIGGIERVEVVAIERDPSSLDLFASLARVAHKAGLVVPIEIDARRADAEAIELARAPRADLIFVGLALNELFADREGEDRLDAKERALRDLCARLEESGSLIAIEPATREISRELQRLRDRFAASDGAPNVFAPCIRSGACPLLRRERDWCHDQLDLALPEKLAELAQSAGLRTERLTYSYLTLRSDDRSLGRDPRAFRVVGGPIASKGKTEWEGCGEAGLVRVRLLDREKSPKNEAAIDAPRGAILKTDRTFEDGGSLRLTPEVAVERSNR